MFDPETLVVTLAKTPRVQKVSNMKTPCLVLLTIVVGFVPSARAAAADDWTVENIFGRRVTKLVLVDWEGPIANPAIKFFITPPAGAELPAKAVLTAKEPRLHFNLPSTIGANGPRKEIEFKKNEKLPVYIAIFPDSDGKDEKHELEIKWADAKGKTGTIKLAIEVIDQDKEPTKTYPIKVDFTQDKTGFFKEEKHRQVIERAVSDWAFYLADMGTDEVPAGKEKTFIWEPDAFKKGKHVTNAKAYTGYLLYAYGIKGAELRSGGEPSREGDPQTRKGNALTIKRSGGLEIETQGNYNKKGWLVSLDDADWWRATNLQDVTNDLYSIAHHELGHSLFFNSANPLLDKALKKGKLENDAIKQYLGDDVKLKSDHFNGIIDPASRRGAFGNEYHGEMPHSRWLITKFDLLAAQAIGYELRPTSPFAPLTWPEPKLAAAKVARPYSTKLAATGGIPFYNWEIVAGTLPEGLTLGSFTGTIGGTPTKAGGTRCTIRVRDYDEKAKGIQRELEIKVAE